MRTIKTREAGKDRKRLDKSVVAGERMKAAYIRAKEKAATLVENRQDTPDEYAAEQVRSVTEDVACETATKEQFVQTTAMTAHKAADAARETGKATAAVVKGTAMVTAVKSMVGTAQKLTAALAAGGGIAVTVIVLICLIGMSVGSGFGVFFSSQDTGSQVMTEIVREIDEEYNAKIEAIKSAVAYDALEMSGSKAAWKEVLAVYAVKTTTDSNTPQEVATTNEGKKTLLREVFWAMNEVSYYTITDDDGTQTTLHITVTHKSADEMAEEYGFHTSQRKQLQELLAAENNSLWNFVLYGVVGGSDEIVAVALSQLGNVGGEPYWSWYGFSSHVEWCACFVSWCANECGYLDAGIVPKFASCAVGVSWFQSQGQWLDNTTEPVPGMIIFFDWDNDGQDGLPDHVGIVEKVENGRVYTVEGNSSNQCRERSYPVGYYEIYGYGILQY
jgi:hypothetical protein